METIITQEKQIVDFVEEYNKHMDWNKDILSSLGINSKYLEYFNLSTDKINEIHYDLENAEIYAYEDSGLLEMQVYSYKTYSIVYFWIKPNHTEKSYKKEKLNNIKKISDKHLSELTSKINNLVSEKEAFLKIKETLANL